MNWHITELTEKIHHNIHLQRAWDKYGPDAFQFSIVEIVDEKKTMVEREQSWLDKYIPFDSQICFNISENASGFTSEEISALNLKNWQDPEYREKMRQNLKIAGGRYRTKLANDHQFREKVYNTLQRASKTRTKKRDAADIANGKRLGTTIAARIKNDPDVREQYSSHMRSVQSKLTFEQLSNAGKIGSAKTQQVLSTFSPEKRSQIAFKGWETRRLKQKQTIEGELEKLRL